MISNPGLFESGDEGGWIRLSSLRHYTYCPRSWALIERECVFDENVFTQRGRKVHERVELAEPETRDGVRSERSLPIWSQQLGLYGVADVVEFHDNRILTVEYKLSSRDREREGELVQLAGQVLCLEEMFECEIQTGAIYHYGSRERSHIEIDDRLRARVREIVAAIRGQRARPQLPAAPADRRCRGCSLVTTCMPQLFGGKRRRVWDQRRAELFHPPDEPGLA
ncbi:MAG: hypothetical protein MAG453_02055 [Calditrichaeota bacterium]|nr:hypothetical protein [Calditrichota bacterium]